MVTAFHALRTPAANSRSNSRGDELQAGGSGSGAFEPPLIVVPPPREMQQQQQPQVFLQSPVPVRLGNLGEKQTG